MLIERDIPGTFTAGPFDILCILKLPTGTFHAAFFEEELRERIVLPDANVIPDKPVEVEEPVNVWVLGNWLSGGPLEQRLREAKWLL